MKKGVCFAVVALVVSFLPMQTMAEEPSIVAAVEAKYANVDTMTANFTQTSRSQLYGDEKQTGDVVLQRPSKMRWNFTGEGKQFVADGSTMWIYSKADNQVIRYNDYSASSASAQSLLQSLDKISDLFEIREETQENGYSLKLTPKEEDGQVKEVQLVLDDQLVLVRVIILDAFDNQTELAFESVQLEAQIPDGTFSFVVPDGVEVIDAGGP